MKKSIFLVVVFMAMLTIGASAQLKYGAKLGLNFATINGDDISDAKTRTGLALGGFVNYAISDKFEFQPELLYSAQGAKSDQGGTDVTMKFNYINIPLMFKYIVAKGFNVQAGPQVGFLVADKWEGGGSSGDISDDFGLDLNSIDFGLNLGLGYQLENGFGIDARYNIGMSQITKEDSADSKNSVIQIAVSYTF